MKTDLKKLFVAIGKNLLGIILGGIPGAYLTMHWALTYWLPPKISEMKFGVEMMVKSWVYILFTAIGSLIIGAVLGAILGVIIVNVIGSISKKKQKPITTPEK
ncbi:hypothetical protein JW962_01140 [Candidatus Dojkabacteria bacterium]|nr:hypothetical protein [Candidatus Dojkabacteria bacterium]